MKKVKLKREQLLGVVRTNREKHVKEFHEAMDGYKESAIVKVREAARKLESLIESLKKGEVLSGATLGISLPVPRNHENDYDQLIRMLEMSVDDVLELDTDEFACYVMDNWKWKQAFQETKSFYGK